MKESIITFIKKEIVLCIAGVLAVLSAFFVRPDKQYLEYIDFRTLAIFFCLMTVMAGLQEFGIFSRLAEGMLKRVKNMRQMVLILVMLCFFFSMLITNDVSLITFVPLTLVVLGMLGEDAKKKWMIPIVVLQTVAANLGSMMTPVGNPQNLYLYGVSGMSLGALSASMASLISFKYIAAEDRTISGKYMVYFTVVNVVMLVVIVGFGFLCG